MPSLDSTVSTTRGVDLFFSFSFRPRKISSLLASVASSRVAGSAAGESVRFRFPDFRVSAPLLLAVKWKRTADDRRQNKRNKNGRRPLTRVLYEFACIPCAEDRRIDSDFPSCRVKLTFPRSHPSLIPVFDPSHRLTPPSYFFRLIHLFFFFLLQQFSGLDRNGFFFLRRHAVKAIREIGYFLCHRCTSRACTFSY